MQKWTSIPRSARIAFRDALHWWPRTTVILLMLRLAEALLPASQVFAVGHLVHAVEAGQSLTRPFLEVTVIVGGFLPLRGLVESLQSRLQLQLRSSYENQLVDILAGLRHAERSDAATSDDIQGAQEAIPFNLAWQATSTITLVQAVATSIALCLSIFPIDGIAAICVLLSLAPALVAHTIVAKTENRLWPLQAAASRRADYYSNQLRYVRSGHELASLGASGQMAMWAKTKNKTVLSYWQHLSSIKLRSGLISGLLEIILLGGAIAAILWHANAPAGAIAGAVLGVLSGILAARGAGGAFGEFMASAPLVLRYEALRSCFLRSPLDFTATGATSAPPSVVSCRNLAFGYLDDCPVLKDISVIAELGKITAFVGVNGAGKTTLLKILAGQLEPVAGEVTVAPTHASAWLSQDFQKFELTVREFLELGQNTPRDPSDLWQALTAAQAADFVRELPNGLDTQLGEQWDGVDLSGGQWQRLALSRTLLSSAAVWILDEPTSAVDAESERDIFDVLGRYKKNRTIMLVSHRAWTLRSADIIYVIANGRIVQYGQFDELMNVEGAFSRMFQEQDLGQLKNTQ